ncbi:transposase [bacterium]|nr:transposase [bacterium]
MIDETYKTYEHNPPHLFRNNAEYFITGATYEHVHYMKSDEAKDIFLNYLFKSFEHYNWKIEDWVVLDNHYHLMANAPENAETLAQVINNVHRFSSSGIKSFLEPLETLECIDCVNAAPTQSVHSIAHSIKKMFHNYWDSCITYENSYYARLHYLWYNPVHPVKYRRKRDSP